MDRPLLFGKFCLLERISVGGMAEVFRAKPLDAPDPDRYFAVKRILPHLAEDVEFIKMFVDEARLTVQLEHPNIVHTYELGQFQSSHYIVMEFIAGKDLLAFQKLVRRRDTILNVDMACHVIREVARGLDYAHRKTDESGEPLGIIHRDISPQNILVSWDGRVRIIDFGIAKAASQSTKTQAGVMKGKFGYLSPEQVRGKDIDRRSDIFAMGTLFWELLTNQRLFNASSQYETMMLIGDPDVEPPSTINDEVPAAVDEIAMKALEAEREQRYPWGSELADELDQYLKSQKPPYHGSQLTTWVRSAFAEEFEEEKEKRDKFRQINSAEDVRREIDDEYGEGGDDADEEVQDATEIWDVDEAPDTDVDLEDFVSNHTVVAAGGLDLEDSDEWEDAPDTVEEIEGPPGASVPDPEPAQGLEVADESEYGGAPTVVTDPSSMSPVVPETEDDAQEPEEHPTVDGALLTPEPTPPEGQRAQVDDSPTGERAPPQKRRVRADDSPTGEDDELAARANASPTGNRASVTAAPTPPQGIGGDSATTGNLSPPDMAANAGSSGSLLRDKRVIGAGVAVAVLGFAGVAAVVILVSGEDQTQDEEVAPMGGLLVETSPVDDLEIFVDGEFVGTESPFAMDELDPGSYSVEIDHPEWMPWADDVDVEADNVTSIDVDLQASGKLVVRWDDEQPEEVELTVNGTAVAVDEENRVTKEGVERGVHRLEAMGTTMRPERAVVVVEADQQVEYRIQWQPIDEVELVGDQDLEVVLEEEAQGTLPVTLSDLDPEELYQLQVGDVTTVLGYPERGQHPLDAEQLKTQAVRDEDDFGTLVIDVESDEWWELVVDDVKTGLVVPETDQIRVAAGDRRVGFQRGDKRYDYSVQIMEGEVSQLQVQLSEPERRARHP